MSRRLPRAIRALVGDLDDARGAFLEALADVDPQLLDAPGLVGEWNGRQLLGHLAYWTEHAVAAIEAAAGGVADAFGRDDFDLEQRNAEVAAADAERPLAELQAAEATAFERLRVSIEGADPAWLDELVGYGDSIVQVIRDDGSDHYREHTLDIRAWFDGRPDEDEEDAADDR